MHIRVHTQWRCLLNSLSFALAMSFVLSSITATSLAADENEVSPDHKAICLYKDLSGTILDPEEYHAHSEPQSKWEMEFVDKIKFKGNENILHAGSADGRVTTHIASKVKQGNVVGVDLSSYMVDFAKKTYESTFKNLSFEQGDVQKLSMNKQFDMVISSGIFHWFKDNKLALESIASVLKHDGHLYLRVYADTINSDSAKQDAIWKAMDKVSTTNTWSWLFYKPESVFSSISKADLEKALQEAGYKNIKVKEITCKSTFKDKQEMLYWLWPWRKVFQRLPSYLPMQDSTYKGFIEDVIDSYSKIMKLKSNENIPFTLTMYEVEAVKVDKW